MGEGPGERDGFSRIPSDFINIRREPTLSPALSHREREQFSRAATER